MRPRVNDCIPFATCSCVSRPPSRCPFLLFRSWGLQVAIRPVLFFRTKAYDSSLPSEGRLDLEAIEGLFRQFLRGRYEDENE